jgi:hypothetical protein
MSMSRDSRLEREREFEEQLNNKISNDNDRKELIKTFDQYKKQIRQNYRRYFDQQLDRQRAKGKRHKLEICPNRVTRTLFFRAG